MTIKKIHEKICTWKWVWPVIKENFQFSLSLKNFNSTSLKPNYQLFMKTSPLMFNRPCWISTLQFIASILTIWAKRNNPANFRQSQIFVNRTQWKRSCLYPPNYKKKTHDCTCKTSLNPLLLNNNIFKISKR